MINLHQLRIFVTVVELNSITRAAERLHLTQPGVSAQLRHLRAFVGGPILSRDGRRVVPTDVGRALYQYAQEVLGTTDVLRRDLTQINSGELDHIVVGGTRAYGTYVLPPILARFRLTHTDLHLSLLDTSSEDLIEHVHAGDVDVAVVLSDRIPKSLVADVVAGHLGEDELIAVESAQNPVTRDQTLSLEDVAGVPFVRTWLGPSSSTGALDRMLTAAGFGPHRVVMDFGTWEGIKEAARAGVGIALTFRSVVGRELANGELRVVDIEGYRDIRSIDLICSPHRRQGRSSRVFEDLLRCLRRELPEAL